MDQSTTKIPDQATNPDQATKTPDQATKFPAQATKILGLLAATIASSAVLGSLVGLLGRGAYVGIKKWRMVPKSCKRFKTYQNVFAPEERKFLINRKREETLIEEACSTLSQVLVFGPKKTGKTTLLQKMTEGRLKDRAIYMAVEKLNTKREIVSAIAKEVGYDPLFREQNTWALTLNRHRWIRTENDTNVDYGLLGDYLEDVSRHYKKKNKNVMPILIIDGVNLIGKAHPEVITELLFLSKHLVELRLMKIVLGTTDGKASRIIQMSRNPFKEHIWINKCTKEELDEFVKKIEKQIEVEVKEIAEKEGKKAEEKVDEFRKMAKELNDTIIGNNIAQMGIFAQKYLTDSGTAKERFTADRLTHAEQMLKDSDFDWFRKGKKESEETEFNLLLQEEIFPKLVKDGSMAEKEFLKIMTDHKAAAKEFITKEVFASHAGMIFFQGKEIEVYLAAQLKEEEAELKKDADKAEPKKDDDKAEPKKDDDKAEPKKDDDKAEPKKDDDK